MPGTPLHLCVMLPPPHPALAPEPMSESSLVHRAGQQPHVATHTLFCPHSPRQEGGWTPASQTNPANQPAIHCHPIWPGKAFLCFCLDRLPFLTMSSGVDYDKERPSLCPRRPGRPQRAGWHVPGVKHWPVEPPSESITRSWEIESVP